MATSKDECAHNAPADAGMALCVLGSGSGGNCSVLIVQKPGARRRVILIDAGLGPRTVRTRLAARGVDVREVTDAQARVASVNELARA